MEEMQVPLDLRRVQRELKFALLSHTELLAVASTVPGGHVPLPTLLLHKHATIIALVAFLAIIFTVNLILTEYL